MNDINNKNYNILIDTSINKPISQIIKSLLIIVNNCKKKTLIYNYESEWINK